MCDGDCLYASFGVDNDNNNKTTQYKRIIDERVCDLLHQRSLKDIKD